MNRLLYPVLILFCCIATSVASVAYSAPYGDSDIILKGSQFSAVNALHGIDSDFGWFFLDDGEIKTNWSNQWVEYEACLTTGSWNIGLNVTNFGGKIINETWYSNFEVLNSLNNEIILIPAGNTEVNNGYINCDIIADGLYSVRYTWLNDKYDINISGDANIQINSVFFDKSTPSDSYFDMPANPSVPLPATIWLLGTGLIGVILSRD